MQLIDSHAHFDLKKYPPGQIQAQLDRAWEEGLTHIIAIAGASRVSDYETTLAIASKEARVYATAGIHPHISSFCTRDALEKLRFTLDHPRVQALGEIGLDYHYNHSQPNEQRRAFIEQLRMAHQANVPVVIHTREAEEDTLAIMRDEGAELLGGVIHCFSSGSEFARKCLELGFHISFSGIVTFPKATTVQEAAKEVPLDRILCETDSPFLSPVPHRGRANEPAWVKHVVLKIAEIRNMDPEELAAATLDNTKRLFRIEQE